MSKLPVKSVINLIPTLETFLNGLSSLLARVSLKPDIASPTVLYWVASFEKCLLVPTLPIASNKSDVLTLPSCTSLTSWLVVLCIDLATALSPAGVCSSISLKSCHCAVGFAAICVACWLKVFIACVGLSADAAKPPKPFTSARVFLVPTAFNCE